MSKTPLLPNSSVCYLAARRHLRGTKIQEHTLAKGLEQKTDITYYYCRCDYFEL